VDETEYRESRLLAKAVARPVQTVSGHLAKLRAANLVRYGEKRVTNSLRENSAEAKKLKRVQEHLFKPDTKTL
jgi:hypothetical protein